MLYSKRNCEYIEVFIWVSNIWNILNFCTVNPYILRNRKYYIQKFITKFQLYRNIYFFKLLPIFQKYMRDNIQLINPLLGNININDMYKIMCNISKCIV